MTSPLHTLADRWRQTACELRGWGADDRAAVLERCASELDATWAEYEAVPLTAAQAAQETGYREGTIRSMWKDGRLPNEGSPRRPRVSRRSLRMALSGDARLQLVDRALAERAAR